MCSVVSVSMKSEYELVSNAILGTDLHFNKEYTCTDIWWSFIYIWVFTVVVPPSALQCNCTVTTTPLIVVIV